MAHEHQFAGSCSQAAITPGWLLLRNNQTHNDVAVNVQQIASVEYAGDSRGMMDGYGTAGALVTLASGAKVPVSQQSAELLRKALGE